VTLSSPAGSTTGGDFRFTCPQALAPCKVSLGAAVITDRSGDADLYPRRLIHKQDGGDAPMSYCEYADGANNSGALSPIKRVPTLDDANEAMQEPLTMGIEGSLGCGSTQEYTSTVDEIWVPAGPNGASAYYDVSTTVTFR
jgi:hypothetical protein